MWWTHPGWKQRCCASCGVNIWDAGGDPDHGVCYECFMVQWDQEHQPSEEFEEFEMVDETCSEVCLVCTEAPGGALHRTMLDMWFNGDVETNTASESESVAEWNRTVGKHEPLCAAVPVHGCYDFLRWEYLHGIPW